MNENLKQIWKKPVLNRLYLDYTSCLCSKTKEYMVIKSNTNIVPRVMVNKFVLNVFEVVSIDSNAQNIHKTSEFSSCLEAGKELNLAKLKYSHCVFIALRVNSLDPCLHFMINRYIFNNFIRCLSSQSFVLKKSPENYPQLIIRTRQNIFLNDLQYRQGFLARIGRVHDEEQWKNTFACCCSFCFLSVSVLAKILWNDRVRALEILGCSVVFWIIAPKRSYSSWF